MSEPPIHRDDDSISEVTGGTLTLNVGPHQKVLPYNATGEQISDAIAELSRLAEADQRPET